MNPILFGVVFGLIMVYLIIDTLTWNPKNKRAMEEKDTRVLKLVADWKYGTKPEGTRDLEDIPPEEKEYSSFWYLHGELENLVEYDKAMVSNLTEGGCGKASTVFGYTMSVEGIIPVEIEGISEPCIGYFWTVQTDNSSWIQRGLVCLKSDVGSCKYAEFKYNTKSKFL